MTSLKLLIYSSTQHTRNNFLNTIWKVVENFFQRLIMRGSPGHTNVHFAVFVFDYGLQRLRHRGG